MRTPSLPTASIAGRIVAGAIGLAMVAFIIGLIVGRYHFPYVDPVLRQQAAGCIVDGEHVITRVIDGDTPAIELCGIEEKLRLIGINTPETKSTRIGKQCFGAEASAEATRLLLNIKVRVETDPSQGRRDMHGRLLAYLHLSDGKNFGEHMLAEGFAHEELYNKNYKYEVAYKAAEQRAKAARKGLWAQDECAQESNKTTVRRRQR